MWENLKGILFKKNKHKLTKKVCSYDENEIEYERDSSNLKIIKFNHRWQMIIKKESKFDEKENYFTPKTKPVLESFLNYILASKEVEHHANMTLASWFFYCCIPMNVLNSFAQIAIDVIVAIGQGYQLSSYYRMLDNWLRNCKEEGRLLLETYKWCWKETVYILTFIFYMMLVNLLRNC